MKYIVASLLLLCLSTAAQAQQKRVAGNYAFKTECLGLELDGSQTLKAWGTGRNYSDASVQAQKNAVRDVLFNGIMEGKSDCSRRPLVPEVNAQEKYRLFFNNFFADGGAYLNYVLLKDERIGDKINRNRLRSREGVTHGLVVRVLRGQLEQMLFQEGILKN
jgi:hypothetical protein